MSHTTTSGTVGPIIFADEIARKQLRERGKVVTFRKSSRTTGETWWRESRFGTKEGDVTVEEIGIINPTEMTDLKPYLGLSGFDTVSEWQNAIASLNGNLPNRGRLYRVEERS